MARTTRSSTQTRGLRRAPRAPPAARTARLPAARPRALSREQLRSFREHARQLQEEYEIPGMAYALIQDGQVAAIDCRGVLRLGEAPLVNADTLFEIGSLTKAFTATQLAMLVDAQKLDWDDRIRKSLGGFAMFEPWVTRELRASDLLSHRSGLPAYCLGAMFLLGFSQEDIIRALRHVEPVTSFRSAYAYQNAVPLVAGQLIEKLSGRRWAEDLVRRIFEPLGMSRSAADSQGVGGKDNVASGHSLDERDTVIPLPPDWPFSDYADAVGPSGGIRSSLNDMVRWALFQLGNGTLDGQPLLSEEGMGFIHAPRTLDSFLLPAFADSYATGWVYRSCVPAPDLLHDGGTLGMSSLLSLTPDLGAGLVLLYNFSDVIKQWRQDGEPQPTARRSDVVHDSLCSRFQELVLERPLPVRGARIPRVEVLPRWRPAGPGRGAAPAPDTLRGTYVNPAYGRFQVKEQAGRLVMVIGPKKLTCPMSHLGGLRFRLDIPDLWGVGLPVTFSKDSEGRITGFACPALADVQGGRFLRQDRS